MALSAVIGGKIVRRDKPLSKQSFQHKQKEAARHYTN